MNNNFRLNPKKEEYVPTWLRSKPLLLPQSCISYISSVSEIYNIRGDPRLDNFIKKRDNFVIIDGYNDYYVQTGKTEKVEPIIILTYYRILFNEIAAKYPEYNFIIVTKYPYGVEGIGPEHILLNKISNKLPENMIIVLATKDDIKTPLTNNGHENKEYDDRLLLYIAYILLNNNKTFNTISRDLYGSFRLVGCDDLIIRLNKKSLQKLGIKSNRK